MKRLLFLYVFTLWHIVGFGQTTLGYHLKKGEVFTIRQIAEQIIVQELDGTSHEITNQINGILEFEVLGELPEGYQLALTFKDLNLIVTSSIQGELMNVKAKEYVEGDVQSKIFNTILNNPVKIILAKTGDILSVSGGDSLVDKMVNVAGLEDEFSKNLMKRSLRGEFGSEALSNSYKQLTYIYPDKKVRVNDQWENAYTGKLRTSNLWTLKGLTDLQTSISGKATVTMDIKDPNTTMKLTGTQNTDILADSGSGFIIKMTIEGISKGTSTMTQLGDQELPTTIKSNITYELINNQHVQQKL